MSNITMVHATPVIVAVLMNTVIIAASFLQCLFYTFTVHQHLRYYRGIGKKQLPASSAHHVSRVTSSLWDGGGGPYRGTLHFTLSSISRRTSSYKKKKTILRFYTKNSSRVQKFAEIFLSL